MFHHRGAQQPNSPDGLNVFRRRERAECKAEFRAMARTVGKLRERLARNSNAAIGARSRRKMVPARGIERGISRR